jgi:protein-tyrosine phosphatase
MNAKSVSLASLAVAFEAINVHYGSMDNYLAQAMALKPTEIEQLKQDYLD